MNRPTPALSESERDEYRKRVLEIARDDFFMSHDGEMSKEIAWMVIEGAMGLLETRPRPARYSTSRVPKI